MKITIEGERNFIGYGSTPPHADWPGRARVALQFVLNYEEGSEHCVLDGDSRSETFLSEVSQAQPYSSRHMSVESSFEYGSRVGIWRVLREFEKRKLPLTIFAVAQALARNQEVASALRTSIHEVACHGLRWISYQELHSSEERLHMQKAIGIFQDLLGSRPLGWYTGRDSPNTRKLVIEEGGFEYDSDYYGDELPFWVIGNGGTEQKHLIIPYTLDVNDMRFLLPNGFVTSEEFFLYLRDTFDTLYEEGGESPKLMSVGLHGRIIGKPGRFIALKKFLDYIEKKDRVWIARRIDIARHWREFHP
ncbi:allantoinase PuuE [Acidithiobacillus sp. IBUN Pt1247-S3]|uniref:allantoinase PuuE n=1 Tax=Acidithiobacillus sp. IBUN Pt1247-S3 TaxID=3166642 RepID=UPI0034E43AEE